MGTGAATAGAADADAGSLTGAGVAAAPLAAAVARVRMTVPSDTVSPTWTLSSRTTPPSGAGTSRVALSDSSVISGSSAFTASPGLTSTSMTGTSLKSPMSGTRTSKVSPCELTGAGGGDTLGTAGAAACVASALSSIRIDVPSDTVSPTWTLISLTVPLVGAGTSMVALSDSSVISGSSAWTLSPGLTSTSMMGTSLKSPMSGTLTAII